MENLQRQKTKNLVLYAVMTAIVVALAYYGSAIPVGTQASLNLSLIPVVLGAALLGPYAGAWLGGVSAAALLLTPGMSAWYGFSIIGTVVTVMLKGILSGLAAGLVFRVAEKINRYLAVFLAAVTCPVVNTGVFLIGCFVFFMDTVSAWAQASGLPLFLYIFVGLAGVNFVIELAVNILFGPTILRILSIRRNQIV